MKASTLNVEALRADFPILQRKRGDYPLAYLDNAATTQKPVTVVERVREFYLNSYANVHRGVYMLSVEATEAYEGARREVARFFGARSWREVVFTRNATEALNLILYAWAMWRLKAGDAVLVTRMEHHANFVPWLTLRRAREVELRIVELREDGTLDWEDLERKLTEEVRLVAVTMVSNVLGVVNPVQEIVRAGHAVGARVVVDAAQAAPHLPLDFSALDCDAMAVSAHKMLGPSGIGALLAKQEWLEEMEPFNYGGDMISRVTPEGASWNEVPWKFEAGTPNIAGAVGFAEALRYLERVGLEAIHAHERQLTRRCMEGMQAMPYIQVFGPSAEERVGVVSFAMEGVHPHDIADFLDRQGICIRAGHHCAQPLMLWLGVPATARASFYLYNTADEVDRLLEALERLYHLFHR